MSETNAAIDIAAVRARHEALFAPNWGKRALVVSVIAAMTALYIGASFFSTRRGRASFRA